MLKLTQKQVDAQLKSGTSQQQIDTMIAGGMLEIVSKKGTPGSKISKHNKKLLDEGKPSGKSKNLIDVVEFCRDEKLPAKVVGRWVWVEFDQKPDKDTRAKMRGFGFRYIAKRGRWAHSCGHACRRNNKIKPWEKYGETDVKKYNLQSAK